MALLLWLDWFVDTSNLANRTTPSLFPGTTEKRGRGWGSGGGNLGTWWSLLQCAPIDDPLRHHDVNQALLHLWLRPTAALWHPWLCFWPIPTAAGAGHEHLCGTRRDQLSVVRTKRRRVRRPFTQRCCRGEAFASVPDEIMYW